MSNVDKLQSKLHGMTTPIHDKDRYQQAIWRAVAVGLDELDQVTNNASNGAFVTSASDYDVGLWSDLTGIGGSDAEETRALILSYIRSNPTITKSVFDRIVSSWGAGVATSVEDVLNYHVDVDFSEPHGVLQRINDISWLIRQTLPAHLTFDVSATQKERVRLASFSGSGEMITIYPHYNDDIINVGQYNYASALYSEEFITINNEVVNNE